MLENQLTIWNNDVLVFINSMDKSYSIGKVENSKDYFDKLTTTLDNIIIAPNIPVLDKSIFIDDIINKTKGYQNIYSKYNYRNVIPEEIKNNLGKVYAYAKAHYGYHPAVQYEQIFTQKKERNKNLVRSKFKFYFLILPEPATLVSSVFGLPLYIISPEPVTLAFKFSLQTTFASPEPVTETSVSLTSKSNP